MLLVGGVLYWLAGKGVYAVTGIQPQERTDVLAWDTENPLLMYLKLVYPALRVLVYRILCVTFGNKPFSIFAIAVIGGLLIAAVAVCVVKKYRWNKILLLVLLTAVLPFGMNCIHFLARGNVHDLMIYAFWFFHIFMLIFAFWLHEAKILSASVSRFIRCVTCVLIGVMLWQNVQLSNTAYVKKEQESYASLSLMTQVVTELNQREDFLSEDTELAFIGVFKHSELPAGMYVARRLTGLDNSSVFHIDTSEHYYNSYKAYFQYVLQYPVRFCSDDTHKRLTEDPRVEEMPTFPKDGSIRMIDGVMVVKMG